jgi:hypothetical protein
MLWSILEGVMDGVFDQFVVDLSNYDWDTFDAAAFYTAGVRRAIVGSQQPSVSRQMVEGLRSEGIEVIGTYDLPYFGSDETTQGPIERAVAFAEQYKIPRVWVDAEIDACQTNVPEWQSIPPPSVAQRQAEFRWCMDLVKAHAPSHGIYTNGGWWTPNMAGSTEWCDAPLWLATYGKDGAAIGPITEVDFGGWTKASLHQYTSIWQVNGRGRDCSYLFAEVAKEGQVGQDIAVRIEALEAAVKDLSWAVFSGYEDRANSDAQRLADVAYRIDQRLGRASDGTTLTSVADNAWVALKAIQKITEATGMSQEDVRKIVGDELSEALDAAQKAALRSPAQRSRATRSRKPQP